MLKTATKIKSITLMALLSLAFHGVASAGSVVGATEYTQILNNFQLAKAYVEQAQQTVHQLNQYNAMMQNLKQITPSNLLDQAARKLWQDQNMMQSFQNLQQIVSGGQQMAYSLASIDSRFKQIHPGYGANFNYGQSYRDWSSNTLNSVKNALSMVTAHAENFNSEQGMMNELINKSQTADGQLAATQAGNQIGVAMVSQMQQLRQLQMAQIRSQGDFMAAQTSERDASKTAIDNIYKQLPTTNSSIK
ncbi:P-type conjugative transfer protein TrbJ [Pseudoduganella danionis]|uniref:P-type conjugative transfer protein TrbJ n=1 Tax=Pseudoduganella danionis TaxID=1890295 RepID=A0ABW9SUH5_9BURK|nr:P-type conjugative transfer protein TrbJ [Pseudoduganella danionis]MTW35520.1 P-type conjugative transfer protein TrbJ [Pseudoduganella danionis]